MSAHQCGRAGIRPADLGDHGRVFGLAPALETSSHSLVDNLKRQPRRRAARGETHQQSAGGFRDHAVCIVLMIGAGLLVRSFWNLTHLDPDSIPGMFGSSYLAAAAE
jgi:hypothetical protein